MRTEAEVLNAGRTFEQIVDTVRAIGEGPILEFSAEADRDARFPEEAFAAIKEARLLGCMVPRELGGDGLSIGQVCTICENMARYDASTAMIFAMHQIQVACIVHHAADDEFFGGYLRDLCDQQLLLASATTEVGVGGDVGRSLCAVETIDGAFRLTKKAPVVSYALNSDAIMVTCRRSPDAPETDQSVVLVKTEDLSLEQISGWDTLGFRATCSNGYIIKSGGDARQVLPVPYAKVLSASMHPVSHLTWGSLWTGLAASAVEVARKAVREAARKSPDTPPVSALRLSEVNEVLFSMRSGLHNAIQDYEALVESGDFDKTEDFAFSIRINNVKVRCSELLVDIVSRSLQIVGISGYKNEGAKSLSRHLRDAYGASLMVNNDRIRGHNAKMQLAIKNG